MKKIRQKIIKKVGSDKEEEADNDKKDKMIKKNRLRVIKKESR